MKKIFLFCLGFSVWILGVALVPSLCVAAEDTGNILGIDSQDLKEGNVDMNSIPIAIASVIQFLIAIAGTIAILMIIYSAVQMQLKSGITGDSSGVDKAKKGVIAAIIGFILAILAWFIMARIIDVFTTISN